MWHQPCNNQTQSSAAHLFLHVGKMGCCINVLCEWQAMLHNLQMAQMVDHPQGLLGPHVSFHCTNEDPRRNILIELRRNDVWKKLVGLL